MYIDRLVLENVRTFAAKPKQTLQFVHPDVDYRPANAPAGPGDRRLPRPRLRNVTLLLGDNGSGKTTVLRSIAAAAFGPVAKDILRDGSAVRHGESTARISGRLRLHHQDRTAWKTVDVALDLNRIGERLVVETGSTWEEGAAGTIMTTGNAAAESRLWQPVYESKNDAFFIVGYGATRRVERLDTYDSGARTKSRATRDLRVQGLFEDAFSLVPLGSWLPDLKSTNPGRYTQVKHLMEKLLAPGQYRFGGDRNAQGDYLFYRGDMPVPFQSLSDGYRAFIGWVADLLYHVCFGCPSGAKLVDSRGIVLVDEIDLHLHPKWQMEVIRTVARALPNMQFIFTSHSPLVAGSLEWMNIITLRAGSKTNRTVAKRLRRSIHGLDADQILLSDFFGLRSTMARSKQAQLERITARIREGDVDAPLKLIQQMTRGTESEG